MSDDSAVRDNPSLSFGLPNWEISTMLLCSTMYYSPEAGARKLEMLSRTISNNIRTLSRYLLYISSMVHFVFWYIQCNKLPPSNYALSTLRKSWPLHQ